MHMPLPLTRDLVLIGGGHAHVLVLRAWGMKPLPGARLTMIDPSATVAYTGMLPGYVAGHYTREALSIDLDRLTRFAGARFIRAPALGIDVERQQIRLPDRPPVEFDLASVDVGVTADLPGVPGFAAFGVPARPLPRFVDRWDAFLAQVAAGDVAPAAAVAGAGLGGVELALSMHRALTHLGRGEPQITLVEAASPLSSLSLRAARNLIAELAKRGIDLRAPLEVSEVTEVAVTLSDGSTVASAFTVAATGAQPHKWLNETGLTDDAGFLPVDACLRSRRSDTIFAAGDSAAFASPPLPKAGVFAVRQAPVLFDNLRAALAGTALRPYRPQRDFLKLISLGDRRALGEKGGLSVKGGWVWRVKDRIDRRFMAKLTDLPAMDPVQVPQVAAAGLVEELGSGQPLCGGCGSKVDPAALRSVLGRMDAPVRDDVRRLPGDDAAELLIGGARQVITTDHLRAVTADPYAMARITAIHALGDIWAMGAEPQSALISVTLPPMSTRLQARTLAEIMDGATRTMTDAGADIAGGHTTQGAEMTIGFSLTGLAGPRTITLGGGKAGDGLILTQAIGSGAILAAAMAQKTQAEWVDAAYQAMLMPQGRAARILAGAHAMTDVTGFGLAGHLLNIARASGVRARLRLDAVPLLAGAVEVSQMGVRSALTNGNRADQAPQISGRNNGPVFDLLFDPQTAGGLLAAVDRAQAGALLDQLTDAGYASQSVGELVEGPPGIDVV